MRAATHKEITMLDHSMAAADTRLVDTIRKGPPERGVGYGDVSWKHFSDGWDAKADQVWVAAKDAGLIVENEETCEAVDSPRVDRGRFADFDADEIEVLTVALRGFPVGSITGLIAKALIAEIGSMPGVR